MEFIILFSIKKIYQLTFHLKHHFSHKFDSDAQKTRQDYISINNHRLHFL